MQINDDLYKILGDLGFTGSIDDRMYKYLEGQGYLGALNNRLRSFFTAQEYTGSFTDQYAQWKKLGYPLFSPLSLFANGEQGVWYDPSDITTMFQDSAGTTPVTEVEQPVGLLLDKSKGLVLGSELVTNGTFDTNITNWASGRASVLSWSSGKIRVTNSATTSGIAQQVVTTVVGKTYRINADISAISGGGLGARISAFTGGGLTGTQLLDYQVGVGSGYSAIFIATTTTTFVSVGLFGGVGNTGFIEADNISVKELAGNHATQPTGTKRPVLSARYNLLTRTEEFDNAAWVSKVNITVTANTEIAPDGTLTADLIIPNAGTSLKYLGQSRTMSSGTAYVTSFYLKSNGHRFIQFIWGGSNTDFVNFDIIGGTVGTVSGSGLSATMVDAGNGWWRCVAVHNPLGASATELSFCLVDSSTAVRAASSTSVSTVFAWGAQLIFTNSLTSNAYQRVVTGVRGTSTAAGTSDYDTNPTNFPPYLKFDGADDILNITSVPFEMTDSHLIVIGESQTIGGSVDPFVLVDSVAPSGGLIKLGFSGANAFLYALRNNDGTVFPLLQSGDTASLNTPYVISARKAVDDLELRVDGVSKVTSNITMPTTTLNKASVGARALTTNSNFFAGGIYSVIAVNAVVSNENRLNTETYVNSKTKAN